MVERVGFFREDAVQGREEASERAVRTDMGWVTRGRTDAAAGSRAPRPLFAPDSERPETSRPGPSRDPSFLAAHRLSQVQSPQKNG